MAKKLTDEEKKDRDDKAKAKQIEDTIQANIRDMRRHWINEPAYTFEVGERVSYGAHKYTIVKEIFDGGKFYRLYAEGMYSHYHSEVFQIHHRVVDWTQIQKYRTAEENRSIPIFSKKDDMFISFQQRALSDLINSNCRAFGCDMSPDYQRGLVWHHEDKIALIDSIFDNRDIGKFVMIRLPYKADSPSYEVLDGKQRINALLEFLENRYAYKGYLFSELNWRDQHHIKDYAISYANVENVTQKQKYAYFLKLNVGGKPQNMEHIAYVQKLYDACE